VYRSIAMGQVLASSSSAVGYAIYLRLRQRQMSTAAENLKDLPDENLTDQRGDEPQAVGTS